MAASFAVNVNNGGSQDSLNEIENELAAVANKSSKPELLRRISDGSLNYADQKFHRGSTPLPPTGGGGDAVEDNLFELFKDVKTGLFDVVLFYAALNAVGIRASDPRLVEVTRAIRKHSNSELDEGGTPRGLLDKTTFKTIIRHSIVLVTKALQRHMIIPDWPNFCNKIGEVFQRLQKVSGGENAQYIPQLARVNPKLLGLSVCSIDGQRMSWGDTRVPFCIQSVSKPFTYAVNLNDFGSEHVHKFIGQEPSGRLFNEICLDYHNKPHNPMINAGAIICASLVQPELCSADRFDYIINKYKAIAGGEFIGFSNSTFLSERETAYRNCALAYFMREYKAFPPHVTNLHDVLDFYFQLCSVEVNCESLSVMAATLANGGFCPTTGERVLSNESCRHTLSLMYSCGLYDYSGMFAFRVGLPAKSGVSGCLAVVVPNVCGFCIFSPPLDRMGNSVRGVRFCEELLTVYRFHNYDNLQYSDTTTTDPRRKTESEGGEKLVHLLFAAKAGNMGAVKRYVLQGVDIDAQDYDGRTAMHVAASEGHCEIIQFLLDNCKTSVALQDRFGHTPLDDSKNFNHPQVAKIIEDYKRKRGL